MEQKIDLNWFLNDFKAIIEKKLGLTAGEAGTGDDYPFLEFRSVNLSIEIHDDVIFVVRYNGRVKYFHNFSLTLFEEKIMPYLDKIINQIISQINKINQ